MRTPTDASPVVDKTPATEFAALRKELLALRDAALEVEKFGEDEIELVHPERKLGARNLVDYIALRQHDIRRLQQGLHARGLSSLGVVQGHVMASLNATLGVLDSLCGIDSGVKDSEIHPTVAGTRKQLESFADDTLGLAAEPGLARIMVTMPSEAGTDASIIESLLAQGMTIMRVNCAHDGPETWEAMVTHLRAAKEKLGKSCSVAFDLAGPKLRTGPIVAGPEVARYKPDRDRLGRTVAPAVMHFGPMAAFDADDLTVIPVDPYLHEMARIGDELHLCDTRGRDRVLPVVAADQRSFAVNADRTTYLTSRMDVRLLREGKLVSTGRIGCLPAMEAAIPLEAGDSLIITRQLSPGYPAILDEDEERVVEPARIGCSLPDVFEAIQAGHRVLLDDGKFEGIVREIFRTHFRMEITRAGRGQAELKAEKGINIPDTELNTPALTTKDVEDLGSVVRHADLVSFSFVHSAQDILELYEHLSRLDADHVGVVLKIENRAAFDRLPELLMTAARRKRIAVMVARGDLGVEIGFERLAEVQEEILWLCEAAQVPVIWATQVLESLAKNGLPSRGEVTDAAMSIRAECVMLNKGPHIDQAIGFLTDLSRRMRQHTRKTFATSRALKVASSQWLEIDQSKAATVHPAMP